MSELQRFVFTMSAGRTGTAFLADLFEENLQQAEVHHEILNFEAFGQDTPDLSHMTRFNSRGNIQHVRNFWQTKRQRILKNKQQATTYVETSHLLMKAGLIENLDLFLAHGEVHLIILNRAIMPTILSYMNRFDFLNKGNQWMWYLDPNYPRNIVNQMPFVPLGLSGKCLWYIYEIRTRAEYYRMVLAGQKNVTVHEYTIEELNQRATSIRLLDAVGAPYRQDAVVIPGKKNESVRKSAFSDEWVEQQKKAIARLAFDPRKLAALHYSNHPSGFVAQELAPPLPNTIGDDPPETDIKLDESNLNSVAPLLE